MKCRKERCPICSGKNLFSVFSISNTPVYQNVPFESPESAKNTIRGDLEICLCRQCGFVFNAKYEAQKIKYTESYDNSQLHSNGFSSYVQQLSEKVSLKIKDKENVLEVGCGQGEFLQLLANTIDKTMDVSLWGFDPAFRNSNEERPSNIEIVPCYYDKNISHQYPADVVICRHVIEHIEQPECFLQSMRNSCAHGHPVRFFFETPTVEWIFQNMAMVDFFYEHCSYFSSNSMRFLFEKNGFEVQSIQNVFGGQYLWLEAIFNGSHELSNLSLSYPDVGQIYELAKHYNLTVNNLIQFWKKQLCLWRDSKKKIAIWGAGAKGVTFLNLVDQEAKLVDFVVDVNPNKQNKFISGTGHYITNVEYLVENGIDEIILMNPNYFEEVKKCCLGRTWI